MTRVNESWSIYYFECLQRRQRLRPHLSKALTSIMLHEPCEDDVQTVDLEKYEIVIFFKRKVVIRFESSYDYRVCTSTFKVCCMCYPLLVQCNLVLALVFLKELRNVMEISVKFYVIIAPYSFILYLIFACSRIFSFICPLNLFF